MRSFEVADGDVRAVWRDGLLRDIAVHGHRLLSAAGFLARTPTWDTVPALATVTTSANQTFIRLDHDEFGCSLCARLTITTGARFLELNVEADALDHLQLNRLGLVALFPMPELTGVRCRVEHADGGVTEGALPSPIVLPPTFTNMRALTYSHPEGFEVRCAFAGEAFEMEDQRLFSDASLKAYSRSNELPRPLEIAAGARVAQTLRIEWTGAARRAPQRSEPIKIALGSPTGARVPPLGLACDLSCDIGLSEGRELARQGLSFAHLTITPQDLSAAVERVHRYAGSLPMALTIDGGGPDLVEEVARQLAGHRLLRVGLTSSDRAIWDAAAKCFQVPIGFAVPVGLPALLRAEIDNRTAFGSFGTAAIIHDADTDAIMATARSLPAMIEAAARHMRCPIHVGPSAIALSRHPHSPAPLNNPSGRHLPMAGYDPRIESRFGAAWVINLMSQCLGAASVTMLADCGPSGIGTGGTLRAAGLAMLDVAASREGQLLAIDASGDDRIAVFAVEDHDHIAVYLANRTSAPLRISLPDNPGGWHTRIPGGDALSATLEIALSGYEAAVCLSV